MRVRPLYWCILLVCCLGTLLFAARWQEYVPAQIHIEIEHTALSLTTLVIHITDTEGTPLDETHITVHATMNDMAMLPPPIRIVPAGAGYYKANLSLTMTGEWIIQISASAQNFTVPRQTLSLMVSA